MPAGEQVAQSVGNRFRGGADGWLQCLAPLVLVSGSPSIFGRLERAVTALPRVVREAKEYPFRLPPGMPEGRVVSLSNFLGVEMPKDLLELYRETYGAQLGEFWLMTAEEIKGARREMRQVYGDEWRPELLPFLWIKDTGDHLVLDLARRRDGKAAILDAYHELPPTRWSLICFGLDAFFTMLVERDFEPFWLAPAEGGEGD